MMKVNLPRVKQSAKLLASELYEKEEYDSYDPKKYEQYERKIEVSRNANSAIFKIFENYFNILYQNPKICKKEKLEIIGFTDPSIFTNTLYICGTLKTTNVLIKYENITMSVTFEISKVNGEIYFIIYFKII